MNEALLPIGMFSRASLLSIKALRAYHEAGILVPARVDPVTGYRTYLATQLTDARVLRRLRELELPLSAVGEIMRARDPDVTKKILSGHWPTRTNGAIPGRCSPIPRATSSASPHPGRDRVPVWRG